MEHEEYFAKNCFACETYNCTDKDGFVSPNKEVGRVRFQHGIPLAQHAFPIIDCPTRKLIKEGRSRKSWITWPFTKVRIISEAIASMDRPATVDEVSAFLVESRVFPSS